MKTRLFLLIAIVSLFPTLASAQEKKPLDHSVYDSWESLSGVSVPYNGKYMFYSVNKQQGDGTLYVYNIATGENLAIPRGKSPVISADGQVLLYRIAPQYAQTHEAKVKKKKGDDLPKDTLVVMNLKSGSKQTFPRLKGLQYGRELQQYVAFQTAPEPPAKGEKKAAADKSQGSPLYLMDIRSGQIDTIAIVEKYGFTDDCEYLSYITKPGKKDTVGVRALNIKDLATGKVTTVLDGDKKMKVELPVYDNLYERFAFYAQTDTTKEALKYSDIYLYKVGDAAATKLITRAHAGIPTDWMVGDKHTLSFPEKGNSLSADGGVLFFGIKPVPEEQDTTIAEFERVKLDIWRWNADYLPTVEAVRKKEFENQAFLTAYYFADPSKVVQIENEVVHSVNIPDKLQGDWVLSSSDKAYRVQRQWETNPHSDIYKVNLRTGEAVLLKQDATSSVMLPSPSARYYTFFGSLTQDWYLYDITTGAHRNLTADLGVAFWNEDTDTPGLPRPYSASTWVENEEYFLIGDRYDLWQFDPKGEKAPFMITEGLGKATNNNFKVARPIHDPKAKRTRFGSAAGPLKVGEPLYLSSFNRVSREHGFYMKDITKKKAKMVKLAEGPYNMSISGISLSNEYPGIAQVGKSQKPPRKLSIPVFAYTKGNFENSTNVFVTKDMFRTETRISNTNPQQKDYNWGTVEMVSWMTADSIKAEGLLFKPENFDPNKKYPVIIYFYEKDSDGLYNYRSPAPSRSIVNIPYFVSNGYIVFDPDIYYTTGHPGQSAMRSIMPAVDMLCQYPWIDSENMAIQGQSWGGYQVAYMITQTDRFKAAGAGAPVSNMTSAYGGIRWGSGVTRQMQYERGQSRIGQNLWDAFDLYVENSPLFFVPNVTTPVLIMHNDKDTAVPWYQGIEFFASLRRCGKQAWMLQYKGEDHNLRERHNCKDLSEKLAEFFDHFLKGAPEPEWMKVK
ncbi:MAG: S9 family peptidase [Bacteroidales bacterium]|nr:S9 family peptidase [Bacteroidales bacterium]